LYNYDAAFGFYIDSLELTTQTFTISANTEESAIAVFSYTIPT